MDLRLTLFFALVASTCNASFHHRRQTAKPVVASTTVYPSLNMQGLNRDSCVSVAWETNQALWVCRDTQQLQSNGSPGVGLIANTASYSGLPSDKSNPQALMLTSPQGFGSLFYKLEASECPDFGACSDGTRWVGWPNTGPVVTFSFNGAISAYQFLARQNLKGLSVTNTPDYSLYHVTSQTADASKIPTTNMDISGFWTGNQVGYGNDASVVANGYAYLYGATPSGGLAVARAALTGTLGTLEDRSLYQFYVNGKWQTAIPNKNDSGITLANTRSAQGTVYFSKRWNSFVWIGGDGFPNANFYISTAPNPEGPWTSPTLFYSGAVGDSGTLTYSTVAHPALTDGTGNYIFLSYSRTITNAQGFQVYDQPLIRVDWQ
ncbi:hypothetical protein BD311DRAFT_686942 [Dichomitus squalens]|uniref:DUF4185 domain-containing protein n=1 Tax=Dichomitus squalens TaxID=114155 RepID=A0A4Q9N1B9_9APHY|nr:hypothetical protein BD311DRAFT_686942 [Dichomitus squalens]